MDKKALIGIAGGLGLLGVLVLVLAFSRGLPEGLKAECTEARRAYAATLAKAEKASQDLTALLETHAFLAGPAKRGGWKNELDNAVAELAKLKEDDEVTGAIMAADDRGRLDELGDRIDRLTETTQQFTVHIDQVLASAKRLVEVVGRRKEVLNQAPKKLALLKEKGTGDVEAKVELAIRDWPKKERALKASLADLRRSIAKAEELGAALETFRDTPAQELLERGFDRKVKAFEDLCAACPKDVKALAAQIEQLYTSWDKILSDMQIEEGATVSFKHNYKWIRVVRQEQPKTTSKWEMVSASVYKKHESYLGMTLESKPKGLFDREAIKVITPPGYTYVGRSHYGSWREERGSRSWYWHDRYHHMGGLYWGRRYRPIYYDDYYGYQRSSRLGRVYVGSDSSGRALYGSSGTHTAAAYASSKYVRTGGFKNTQYKQSGGKYRGSRYAKTSHSSSSRSSSSSSSRRSSSSTRRGSRSSSGSRRSGK